MVGRARNGISANRRCTVKLNHGLIALMFLSCAGWLPTRSALAQTSGGSLTLRFTSASPFVALLAGILILIFPRLLNYIVAIYLILVGLIGLFGY